MGLARFAHRDASRSFDFDMERRNARNTNAVLDAALTVADRDGLRGVTIRALAAEVGAAPMSLYSHFSNKDQLYDRMFERVAHQLFAASGKPTWQEELEAGARTARSLLLRHPHWLPLVTRVTVPPFSLGLYDRVLRLMSKESRSPEAAMLAIASVMSFTLGLVLVERMMTAKEGVVVPIQQLRIVSKMLSRLRRGIYPGIAATAAKFDRWSFDRVFDVGIRSLIVGIELDGSRRSAATRRRTS
jgi:AcrR family transcriptional regulator